MNPSWEESEYVFCDLQAIARHIRRTNPDASLAFLNAAYDAFEFLSHNPGIGRKRDDLGFPGLRSWRVKGYRSHLIFYRELPDRIQIWRILHGSRDLHRGVKE